MAKSRNAKERRRSSSARSRGSRSSMGTRARSAGSSRGRNGGGRDDAIALLKADHREVERLFGEFERAGSNDHKHQLAGQICLALRTHTTIEEEIFYPAFLEATEATDIHHEAEIEHEGLKRLIEEIESLGSRDDHFEARITVLHEMIRHHVKEEEQRGGMFSKAQQSEMDLRALGRQLLERQLELMGESVEEGDMRGQMPPRGRARGASGELRTRSG